MIYLLDVNVLIALIDPAHTFSDLAHDWFAADEERLWASCPLTQNGAVRILGSARYPGGPGGPAGAAELVAGLCAHPRHVFWPDDINLLTHPGLDISMVSASGQVTDTYLLALAVSKGGRLATLDRRLSVAAVAGGDEGVCLIAAERG